MRQFIWCLLLCTLAPTAFLQAQNQAQLVVFVQPGRSISKDFIRRSLPQIESFAKGQNIPLKVVDATKGAPSEVTLTPSVFYQKNDEYTRYEGRYSDLKALQKFVRTKGKNTTEELRGEKLMVWNPGRTTIAAHCKIHPVEGAPSDFDKAKAWNALREGMSYFQKPQSQVAPELARSFHVEFFPKKTADGLMLVHMSLFSEFDLENPVFQSDIPSGSEWKEWEVAFEKASKRLEVMLMAQLGSNENGDGFEFVRKNVPLRSWDSLVTVQPKGGSAMTARVGK
jgi:hypothetical protein